MTAEPSAVLPDFPDSPERLIEAARRGSAEALGQLLRGSRQYLLLVANLAIEPDLQAKFGASDLVQETFLKAHEEFGQFRGTTEAELLAWLCRTLLNTLADFQRQYRHSDKRRVAREISLDANPALAEKCLAPEAPAETPSGQMIGREQEEALERAIARLPEDYRRAIVLHQRERRSFAEIGRLLGRSAEAARKLWFRALAQLKQELNPSHDER